MRDSQWVVPVAILLIVQHSAAFALSHMVRFTERPPTLSYMLIAFVLSLIGGVAILLSKLWRLWRQDEARPALRLIHDMDVGAISTYFLGFQLVALQIAALTWLKEMLPLIVPYWADPLLARLEHAILGVDAWRLIPEVLVGPLDAIYPSWAPVKFFGLVLMLSLPPSTLKAKALIAYFLTVGFIGVGGQYLLSSGGPVFYDRLVGAAQFTDLTARINAHAPIVSLASAYLWNAYTTHDTTIGSGISAMPSMHVATTAWTALALSAFWPRIRPLMWGFWFVILVGSIGLGWHYLLDGMVGTGGAILCWKTADLYLSSRAAPRGRLLAKGV